MVKENKVSKRALTNKELFDLVDREVDETDRRLTVRLKGLLL